ncbi:MAG TPA: MlaA family lipoprotein, partial [bacterium]|nr:MlaA family lipoprotein [bacterium]
MRRFSRNLGLFVTVSCILFYSSAVLAEEPPVTEEPTTEIEQDWTDFQDEYTGEAATRIGDPLRGMNRTFYHFNDIMMVWFITPVSEVWGFILPQFARFRIQDLVDNLGFPRRFLNTLFQGRPGRAGIELSRFVVNCSLGLGGLWD